MKDALWLARHCLKQRVTRGDVWLAIVVTPIAIALVHIVANAYSTLFVPLLLAMIIGGPAIWLVSLRYRIRRAMRNVRVIQFDFRDKPDS